MAFRPENLHQPAAAPAVKQRAPVEEEKILLEEERLYRQGAATLRDLIAPASFKVDPNFLALGDTMVRTLFVIGYPRYIMLGWFAPIINLNHTLDVGMYFYPVRSEVILKQLRKKTGMLEAQLMMDRDKGMPRDPVRESALRDVEELRDN